MPPKKKKHKPVSQQVPEQEELSEESKKTLLHKLSDNTRKLYATYFAAFQKHIGHTNYSENALVN